MRASKALANRDKCGFMWVYVQYKSNNLLYLLYLLKVIALIVFIGLLYLCICLFIYLIVCLFICLFAYFDIFSGFIIILLLDIVYTD